MRLVALFLITALLGAADATDVFGLPDWILPGILFVESQSRYLPDGTIQYVDRRVGRAGELGCTQITRAAFDTVAQRGESFRRLATDPAYAERIAARYLWWVYEHTAGRNWDTAVMQYNCGSRVSRAGRQYLAKIRRLFQ